MTDERTKILGAIDVPTQRGVEIGPLHHPRLRRDEGNVRYLDHATRDELRAKYEGNAEAAAHLDDLVDVDYIWSPGKRLIEVVGDWAPVDFVIASHLIEHLPNPVGWLHQVAELLRPGGVLSLVIPDKRYCFDAKRRETTLSQLVDSAIRERDLPTFQQIFDHESNFLGTVAAAELWAGTDVSGRRRGDVKSAEQFALARCLHQRDTGEYLDVHASVFTPTSFLEILEGLIELDWLDFMIVRFYPTEVGSLEFFVTLERLPHGLSVDERRDRQRSSVNSARGAIDAAHDGTEAGNAHVPARRTVELSAKETRLIELKRATLRRLRSLIRP